MNVNVRQKQQFSAFSQSRLLRRSE